MLVIALDSIIESRNIVSITISNKAIVFDLVSRANISLIYDKILEPYKDAIFKSYYECVAANYKACCVNDQGLFVEYRPTKQTPS